MEGQEHNEKREEIFSRAVKAGKRTYFFDVKSTRGGQYYLTITESKRRFSNEQGKFFYEKHKVFLFREDFEKFIRGLDASIRFIELGQEVSEEKTVLNIEDVSNDLVKEKTKFDEHKQNAIGLEDVRFEDLGKEE